MIRLPRLLDASMHEICRLDPISLALEMNLAPLSTADMTLPASQPLTTGQYIELFIPQGSAGVFRVQQTEETFSGTSRLQLSHGLVSLADSILPGATEGSVTLSAREALAAIFARQSLWQLGQIDVPADVLVTWSYDHPTLLEALGLLLKELPGYHAAFDQSALPWTMHLLALSDADPCECRLSRNLQSVSLETDRSELCTQLYIPGVTEPLNADTQSAWGVVSRAYSASSSLTTAELTARASRYLEEHKHPQVSVSLSALDLSQTTGESLDRFTLGRLCRVCLPEQEITINQRVTTLAWPDLVATPTQVRLTLANRVNSAADVLSSLIVDATEVRRQMVQQTSLLTQAQEKLELMAREISLKADNISLEGYVTIDGAAEILENATIHGSLFIEDTLNAYTLIGTEAFIYQADIYAMTLAEQEVSWKSQRVLTGIGTINQSKRYLTLATPDGGSVTLDIVTDVSITPAATTISYLGG